MDVVEKRTHSLRCANITWNIFLSSLFNHLNGKTRFWKMGPIGVLMAKKDVKVIKWTLTMQKCGLSINLHQLKMKVAKLTQTRPTLFQNGIPSNSWWYQFKLHKHPKLNICRWLEVYKTQGLTPNTCKSFYTNLQALYNQNSHVLIMY